MNCTPNVRQNIWGVVMSRFSFTEKYEAVNRVIDGMSMCESARIVGTDRSTVRQWCHLYELHGWDALRNGGASYDGKFKIVYDSGRKIYEHPVNEELLNANLTNPKEAFNLNFDQLLKDFARLYMHCTPQDPTF